MREHPCICWRETSCGVWCVITAGHTWQDNLGGILYGLGGSDDRQGGGTGGSLQPSTEVGVGGRTPQYNYGIINLLYGFSLN